MWIGRFVLPRLLGIDVPRPLLSAVSTAHSPQNSALFTNPYVTLRNCSGKIKHDMRPNKLSLIVICALMAAAGGAAFAQLGTPDQVVTSRIALSADKLKPGSDFELAVVGSVKSGYHIGARDSALYAANLAVTAPAGVTLSGPAFPAGVRKAFPFAPNEKIPVYEGTFVIRVKGHVAKSAKPGPVTFAAKLDTQACKGEQCYPPQISQAVLKVNIAKPGEKIAPANTDLFKPTAASGQDEATGMFKRLAGMSLWVRLAFLFVMGLLMAFTPCVYPMIPVTVGYFSSQADKNGRRVYGLATTYVLGIALTYSTLGVIAAVTGKAFGEAMQKPAVSGGIALVLIALALSMFGLYELQPPAFITNRASGKSGILGALTMGLIFGIAAAPCAGPFVLGLMLLVASLGNPLMGFVMFFVMSIGFGAPLFLLAAFSGKMPVPGMWMVAVKKAAGFLLIGAALHFGGYVLPAPIQPYLIPAVVLVGGVYLGFFEKSLASVKFGSCFGKAGSAAALTLAVVMLMNHGPRTFVKWETYTPNKLAQAALAGKPVMIEFTANWCQVCRELEHATFSDPAVINESNRFVRLRVDGSVASEAVDAAKAKFDIHGFPAVILIDSTGAEIRSQRVVRFVDASELIKRMAQVR